MLWFVTFWDNAPKPSIWIPYYPRLNEQPCHQLLNSFMPSHRHIKEVSITSTATICCITNNTTSFHTEFSYLLSVCSPILFMGTVMSKTQQITMVPSYHHILTFPWVCKTNFQCLQAYHMLYWSHYFLSVCFPILFMGTVMSKTQQTTMAPSCHHILTFP